ncbi:uncharacterized protein J8A68_000339 [[Candida] subhashii]|uniref:Uncharacterized protein n=1 Tax=[Candida] subhashii TaxID=561895 RepID=A0A8J5QTT9_9ASCO|nr:uncharacterized protein J8A68_000339 [[Candida] subhashii]KAG7666083.1 hypothetical protein J8A68_000339 [[Candida] subhashii]
MGSETPSEIDNTTPATTKTQSTPTTTANFPINDNNNNDHHQSQSHSATSQSTPNNTTSSSNDQSMQRRSQFMIPNDILKNLTPIKSKPSSYRYNDHLHPIKKKQDHLKSIQFKLRIRSQMIQNQIMKHKQQQQSYRDMKVKRLSQRHLETRRRRLEYLKMIRERARRVVFVKMNGDGMDGRGRSSGRYERVVWKNGGKKRVEGGREREGGLGMEEEVFGGRGSSSREIVKFQRICRRYLFNKYLKILIKSQFLNEFEGYSFNQIINILNNNHHEITKSIYFILNYLNVSKLRDYEYKSFMYCFIMINDFNDCMKGNSQYHHPASNANVNDYDERSMFFNNSIWVIVYKYTILLLEEFKVVVAQGKKTKKFDIYWRQYSFYFKVFKWNHYLNIKEILISSIEGLNNQFQMIEDLVDPIREQLTIQQMKLSNELTLLNSYSVHGLKRFISTNEVNQFMNNLNCKIYDNHNNCDYFIINNSRFIKFNSLRFYIPYVPIFDWRKYWFDLYLKIHSNKNEIPNRIKSGYVESFDIREYIDVNEVTKHISTSLQDVYQQFYQYYTEFIQDTTLKRKLIEQAPPEGKSWNSLEELIRFCEPGNMVLIDLIKNYQQDEAGTIKQLSIVINNYWINKTKFKDFNQYQQFDNIYLLINCNNFPNLNFNWYTFNPQLLFPKFYKSIIELTKEDDDDDYFIINEDVVNCSFKNSLLRIIINNPITNINGKFFMNIFNKMILRGNIEINELNVVFYDKFISLHYKLTKLIELNTFILMYLNYYHNHHTETVSQGHISQIITNESFNLNEYDSKFVEYYQQFKSSIIKILQEKLLIALNDPLLSYDIILKNFKYSCCIDKVIKLIDDVNNLNSFIYKLYNPILNWIYFDLK